MAKKTIRIFMKLLKNRLYERKILVVFVFFTVVSMGRYVYAQQPTDCTVTAVEFQPSGEQPNGWMNRENRKPFRVLITGNDACRGQTLKAATLYNGLNTAINNNNKISSFSDKDLTFQNNSNQIQIDFKSGEEACLYLPGGSNDCRLSVVFTLPSGDRKTSFDVSGQKGTLNYDCASTALELLPNIVFIAACHSNYIPGLHDRIPIERVNIIYKGSTFPDKAQQCAYKRADGLPICVGVPAYPGPLPGGCSKYNDCKNDTCEIIPAAQCRNACENNQYAKCVQGKCEPSTASDSQAICANICQTTCAGAQPLPGQDGGSTGGTTTQTFSQKFNITNPLNVDSIEGLAQAIGKWLFRLAIPIAVIMILYSGLMFLTAGIKPDNFNEGKKILTWTIIGLSVMLIGRGFISLITSILQLRP